MARLRTWDVAIAAFFVVAQQLEVWAFWVPSEQGPRGFAALMGLAMTLPLLTRRRAPLASLLTSVGVLFAWTLIDVPQGSLWPWLTLLVLVFSVAAHTGLRTAVCGLVSTVAAWTVFVAVTTNSFADYALIQSFTVLAWVAGRAVRARQLQADSAVATREEHVRAATEHERARIARELHDIISHSVSVMVVQAGAAEQVLVNDPQQAAASLRSIQDAGRQARLELRRLLGLMRADDGSPAELSPQPGLGELAALVEQLRPSGLDVELDVQTDGALPAGLDLAAYRVVQEALTNALKHGGRGSAWVVVRREPDALELEVLNAGQAAPPEGSERGFGLIGMGERIAVYGGRLDYGPRDDGTFCVHARLPLGAAER